jgi:hypothetical protein
MVEVATGCWWSRRGRRRHPQRPAFLLATQDRTARSTRFIGLGVEDEFSGSVSGVDVNRRCLGRARRLLSGACKMWSPVCS